MEDIEIFKEVSQKAKEFLKSSTSIEAMERAISKAWSKSLKATSAKALLK